MSCFLMIRRKFSDKVFSTRTVMILSGLLIGLFLDRRDIRHSGGWRWNLKTARLHNEVRLFYRGMLWLLFYCYPSIVSEICVNSDPMSTHCPQAGLFVHLIVPLHVFSTPRFLIFITCKIVRTLVLRKLSFGKNTKGEKKEVVK